MVRGQGGDDGLGIALVDDQIAQPGRRAAVPPEGLDDEVFQRDFRRLGVQAGDLILAGDDVHMVRGQQRLETPDAHLKHGLVTDQAQHLLGPCLAAERPQPRAPAARHDQGVIMLR